jgi:hypothetical protein
MTPVTALLAESLTRVTALLAGSVEPGDGDDGKVHHLPVVNLGETLRAARVTELHLGRFALTKKTQEI